MRHDEQRFCLLVSAIAILLGIYRLSCGDYEAAEYPTLLWICMLNQYRVSKIEEDHDNSHSQEDANNTEFEFKRWN